MLTPQSDTRRYVKRTTKNSRTKSVTETNFDYDGLNFESAGLAISFFRYYPDYFADMCRSPYASYTLALPQRMMLRLLVRYRLVYITGVRGLTKTYIVILAKMIRGLFYPGIKIRYTAPDQKQAAMLATQAFHQIERDYPLIASHWILKNDREDMFRIQTPYGSEFTMYSARGDNSNETVAEEIGQEGKSPFDMEAYETDIIPTCRIIRMLNFEPDPYMMQNQHSHISNACSKNNPAYYTHRANCLREMIYGDPFEGYVIDFSWVTAIMSGIRTVQYVKDQKASLTKKAWDREMCALYSGDTDNPLISEESLVASRVLPICELKHCGDPNVIYIVSHDVSYTDGTKSAKCADAVLKLTRYEDIERRDRFRKQLVFCDNYPPPSTDFAQAEKLRRLWKAFCMNGANATYLVVDAHAYGTGVVEELMKPTSDGSRPLCCYKHMGFQNIEQPNALPVIYPMKATTTGGQNADGDMITYAQLQYDQGAVEMLIPDALEGVEQYKRLHGIKTPAHDAQIAMVYKQSNLLVQQIQNLKVEVSGQSIKERRKSGAIQRDIWSAFKYALWIAHIIEVGEVSEKYRRQSSWQKKINETVNKRQADYNQGSVRNSILGNRASLIARRSKVR